MLIDGKEFKTYSLDNLKTITNRFACKNSILPRFIHIDEEGNLTALDKLLNEQDITHFFDDFKRGKFKEFPVSQEDLLFRIYKVRDLEHNVFDQFSFIDELKKFNVMIETIERNYPDHIKMIKLETDRFISAQNEIEKNFQDFDRKKDVSSTPTEITYTRQEITFEVNFDIFELFNNINLSSNIPFVSINDYYKMIKNFTPFDVWTYSNDILEDRDLINKQDVMFIKILTKSGIVKPNIDSFSTISIFFENFPNSERNTVHIIFETKIFKDLGEQMFIERVLSIFPEKSDKTKIQQFEVHGQYYIPEYKLDYPIILDIIMNNPFLSTLFFVDELSKITKEKKGITIYFKKTSGNRDENDLPISRSLEHFSSFSLIGAKVEVIDSLILGQRDKRLVLASSYVLVKLNKYKNNEEGEHLKMIVNKLMSLCLEKRHVVIDKYKKFVPHFEEEISDIREEIIKKEKKTKREELLLKDINPDLFLSGYQRKGCQKNYNPKIVSETDANKMADQEIMKFPKSEEEGKRFNYVCNHNEFAKYPCLKRNRMENSKKYPIVPCCCVKDPTLKQDSYWKQYYESDIKLQDFTFKEKKGVHQYTTNKILSVDRYGELFGVMRSIFVLANIENKESFSRVGSIKSPNSFIECVLKSSKPINEEEILEEREKIIDYIKEYSHFYNASIYDDENKYIDPKMFIPILEIMFKVNIFVFSFQKNGEGTLISPFFEKDNIQYEKNNLKRKNIFILEHFGSDFDKLEYPQCELIMRNEKEKTFQFSQEEEIVKKIREIFNKMYPYTVIIDPRKIFVSKIKQQGIDFFEKTRFILFDGGMNIFINPVPPLVGLSTGQFYKEMKKEEIKKFMKDENILKSKNVVSSGFIVGIEGEKQNLKFFIPMVPEKTIKPSTQNVISPTNIYDNSQIQLYSHYQRITRYIVEYMFYLFSIKYKTSKKSIDKNFIIDFSEEYMEIDKDFVYEKIGRVFSLDSPLLRNGKLIVTSEEIKKRLIYSLIIQLQNSKDDLINYSDHRYMQKYYSNIDDFKHDENHIIIIGQDSLVKFIDSQSNSYRLQSSVIQSGRNLISDLKPYGIGKLFVFMFISKKNKVFMNKVHSKVHGKYEDLTTKYKNVKFVYVTIEDNKDIFKMFDISKIPTILFMNFSFADNSFKEEKRIKGAGKIIETIRLVNNAIKELLN
jgi:hypothetical protein